MNSRQRKILDLLLQRQELSVQKLAKTFDVSPMTIRRDLEYLESQRLLTRTHGGAIHTKPAVIEFEFLERTREGITEKQAIARFTAEQVKSGMTLVLDTGTTTLETARALAGIPGLRILTTSLAIASVLYTQEYIELILLGGNVRHNSPDLTGPLTEENLARFRTEMAIIGADAVVKDGLFTSDLGIARLTKAMISHAQETWLVVDSRKFSRQSFVKFGEWSDVHHVVTDAGIPDEMRDWVQSHVPHLHIVT